MKSSSNQYYNQGIVLFKSTQIYHNIIKISKMNIDDDTQKEKIIIPSFWGVEDVSVGKFSHF